MVNVTINGISLQVEEGTSILDATRKVGMPVPTLCFLKGINEIGACRACLVEVEGISRLITACNNTCEEGMVIHTNTPRVREARRTNIELLLSQHRINCPTCERNGTCELQKIASTLPIGDTMNYRHEYPADNWDTSLPIIRDESKCIKCYRCVSVCEKIQSLNIWDMVGTGAHTSVNVSRHRKMNEADCAFCGQCITHCPTNALHTRDDTKAIIGVNGVLSDPNKVVVVQVAPAVRAAWGETFGLSPEVATEKRMAAALRRIGFDYVFDTNFTADLTIMEEGTEFLGRLQHPGEPQVAHVYLLLPRLGALPEEPVSRHGGSALHGKIPPADVRRSDQELLRQEDRRGSREYRLRVHHALHRQEGGAGHSQYQRCG